MPSPKKGKPFGRHICRPYGRTEKGTDGAIANFRSVCRGRIDASRAVYPLCRNVRVIATGGIYAAPTDEPVNFAPPFGRGRGMPRPYEKGFPQKGEAFRAVYSAGVSGVVSGAGSAGVSGAGVSGAGASGAGSAGVSGAGASGAGSTGVSGAGVSGAGVSGAGSGV